jgi:hypothetical protein
MKNITTVAKFSIYKYSLEITDYQKLTLPVGAEIMAVKEVGGELVLYAVVDTDPTSEKFALGIFIFGTGQPLSQMNLRDLEYLDTVPMSNGLVWHVYFESKAIK